MVDRQTKEDRKLINNVKLHPALYDATHVSYNNRFERKRIWELISQSLDSTGKFPFVIRLFNLIIFTH